LSESRAQDYLLDFFLKVLVRSKTNACLNQGLKIICWFFFRSSCLVKNQCLFKSRAQDFLFVFFRSSCSIKNQCLSGSRVQDCLLVSF
jgi:hypothetical protein